MEYKKLTDLLEFIVDNRGKTVPTSEAGIKLIATNCILNNRLFPVYEKVRYVSKEIYDTWFRSHPKPGDIIFVNKGTPGKVCMVPEPIDFCIAQDMMAFRVDSSKIYNKYLFAVLRSSTIQNQIANSTVGTLIPHYKKEQLKDLMIPVPDSIIQKKIGDIYYNLSYKIELNNQINNNLYELGDNLYKEYFGNEKEELHTVKLSEVACNYDYKRKPMSSRERGIRKGNYPYYGATSIIDYVDDYIFDDIYVLMGEDGTVKTNDGKPILQYIWGKNWINNHAHVLQGIEISTEHLLFALRSVNVESLVTGAVQLKINQENMNKIEFKIGNKKINNEFNGFIQAIMNKIREIKEENETLAQLRDTLLPKLMSGEIDLDNIEI